MVLLLLACVSPPSPAAAWWSLNTEETTPAPLLVLAEPAATPKLESSKTLEDALQSIMDGESDMEPCLMFRDDVADWEYREAYARQQEREEELGEALVAYREAARLAEAAGRRCERCVTQIARLEVSPR